MTPHSSVHEVEFWKRYRTLKGMLEHLRTQESLILALQNQFALSDQVKDAAVTSLKGEGMENMKLFHDYLLNFLTFSQQGLHRIDILLSFSIGKDGDLLFESASICVDDVDHLFPPAEGIKWLEPLKKTVENLGRKEAEKALLDRYKLLESKYDRLLGGSLDRCSLLLLEEVYPKEGSHVRIRLPAQAYLDVGED